MPASTAGGFLTTLFEGGGSSERAGRSFESIDPMTEGFD